LSQLADIFITFNNLKYFGYGKNFTIQHYLNTLSIEYNKNNNNLLNNFLDKLLRGIFLSDERNISIKKITLIASDFDLFQILYNLLKKNDNLNLKINKILIDYLYISYYYNKKIYLNLDELKLKTVHIRKLYNRELLDIFNNENIENFYIDHDKSSYIVKKYVYI
jgi:hypothetical protein